MKFNVQERVDQGKRLVKTVKEHPGKYVGACGGTAVGATLAGPLGGVVAGAVGLAVGEAYDRRRND